MNRILHVGVTLASAALLALSAGPVRAGGEGMINEGKALPYQTYLAPRPAAVLIYANPDPTATDPQRQALYAGLERAGHKLTVVTDTAALASALRDRHYDVVIASFDAADIVTAATVEANAGKTTVVPVVARDQNKSPQVRGRYGAFLVDGASLGQYLKTINTVMAL